MPGGAGLGRKYGIPEASLHAARRSQAGHGKRGPARLGLLHCSSRHRSRSASSCSLVRTSKCRAKVSSCLTASLCIYSLPQARPGVETSGCQHRPITVAMAHFPSKPYTQGGPPATEPSLPTAKANLLLSSPHSRRRSASWPVAGEGACASAAAPHSSWLIPCWTCARRPEADGALWIL